MAAGSNMMNRRKNGAEWCRQTSTTTMERQVYEKTLNKNIGILCRVHRCRGSGPDQQLGQFIERSHRLLVRDQRQVLERVE